LFKKLGVDPLVFELDEMGGYSNSTLFLSTLTIH